MPLYYFDTLPLHPPPEPLESLVSYLIRLAEENGIKQTGGLDALTGQKASTTIREWSDYPRAFETLQKLTLRSEDVLLRTTFYHLGRKFGRSSEGWYDLQGFLSGSVNTHSLRYCPMCLSERPYYPLTWRFVAVQGCHLHACQILEKCGHCGSTVSGYANRLRMAFCPRCNGDLRTCPTEHISTEKHRKAIAQFEDLEFLLSPQAWEEYHDAFPEMIGQVMARLRREKGLTLESTCHQSRISLASLGVLERGPSLSKKGVSFQGYLAYAAFLGVTLREIFDVALRSELNHNSPAKLKSKILYSEDELVETARHAIEGLRASGKPLTRTNIVKGMGIPYQSLTKAANLQSPRVRELLRQIGDEIHDDEKWQQEHESDDMLEKVQQAIQQLWDRGEYVTFQAVGNIVGVPVRRFRFYPESQALIKQHASYLHPKTQQARLREDEMVESVQRAIQLLEASHQRVTGTTVCRTAGISRSCLTTYPCLRTIVDQHADTRCRAQLERITQRENELLVQVEEAVRKLRSLNQRVTQKAIAEMVGISQGNLRRYPRVKALLDEKAGMYHHNTRTYSRERANELAQQVQAAKAQLESSGRKVTQEAVAEMLGVTAQCLMYYPNVRLMLLQEKPANQTRSAQGALSEEQLLRELEKVIQQLELQGITVTFPKVSAGVGVTPAIIYRYPQCVSAVKKAFENQKRKRFELREEELLQNVQEAIQRLRESGLPVTNAAIARAIHITSSCLQYYPKVRSFLEHIAKGQSDAA